MARRSLKAQLNQIRGWVRQGRTDAWIAHQLDVSVKDIEAFKREHALAADGGDATDWAPGADDELDLRAEDDALVAAALEAEPDEDDDEDESEENGENGDGDGTKRRRYLEENVGASAIKFTDEEFATLGRAGRGAG